ncbi:26S proteasome non-ATPase regulatory subunit 4 homolog [Rosa rugosa]|uniref:26S proteasome non-ATPase regulatory subunit 4 homolog n=1 Tax=Rosa rugosa TaxID=74645 RepID=UPI002B413291|nr:26S proteasome non-ATPase regulatory subunit 4 homolog [Rosa rugosa]
MSPFEHGEFFVLDDGGEVFYPSSLQIGGEMNLAAGIQVAQLALKHRQNKKQQQRIIVFAGRLVIPSYACDFTLFFASSCILTHFDLCVAVSAVKHEKKTLEMIGRKLKKNSVALDIINFGEEDEEKSEKLEALLAAVNNNDTSHIVHVSAGPSALSDVLISTPIFTGDGEGGSGIKMKSIVEASKPWPSLPGVDPNDPSVRHLLASIQNQSEREFTNFVDGDGVGDIDDTTTQQQAEEQGHWSSFY